MTDARPNRILGLILGGLLVWGIFLAVGTLVFPLLVRNSGPIPGFDYGKMAIQRALIILGCTLAFVTFWGLMLWLKSNGSRKPADSVKFPPAGA